MFRKFLEDQSGAVTVDWVVMTAATVGIGIASAGVISSGLGSQSTAIGTQMTDQAITTAFGALTTAWNGMTAADYINYGQGLAPGNNGAVYGLAQTLAQENAPAGYNFNNPLVDSSSGQIVYTSDDGQSYSAGGVVTSVADYEGVLNPFTA